MRHPRLPDGSGPVQDPATGRASRVVALVAMGAVLIGGCDSVLDRPTRTTGTAAAPTTVSTPTTQTITPVTPDGLITGPGVTDETITLGVLVDPDRDRGFSDGIELWQQAVNTSGGLCGRSVQLAANGSGGAPFDVVEGYDAVGRTVVGLITLPPPTEAVALNSMIAADQIPTLTPTGTSTQLGPARPIVIGPTQDILAINALDFLSRTGAIQSGGTVGVLTDGSAVADNALAGATWWAAAQDVVLDIRTVERDDNGTEPGALTDWGDASFVLALTDAQTTGELVTATPTGPTVVTMIDGYDPASWSAAALEAATAGRVLVSTAAPAYGSDYPAAVAVASRAAAAGLTNPGPRLLDGYATGQSWARMLIQACNERTVTRSALQSAATTVGAASVDFLYGPSDPSAPVLSGLPATRVSAMSSANPSAPSGLTPLTWPEAATDIEDYVP